jgi:hypothetical protein
VLSASVVSHTRMQEPVRCDSNGMNIDIEGCRTDNAFHKQHEQGSKCDGSDSGPDEAPVLRENGGDTFHTSVESHKCKGIAENPRKRRRHHKRNSYKEHNSPATEKRESTNNERSSLNKSSRVRQRKLTLLEKVSECNAVVWFLYCSREYGRRDQSR